MRSPLGAWSRDTWDSITGITSLTECPASSNIFVWAYPILHITHPRLTGNIGLFEFVADVQVVRRSGRQPLSIFAFTFNLAPRPSVAEPDSAAPIPFSTALSNVQTDSESASPSPG
jgi:hypothetical protein